MLVRTQLRVWLSCTVVPAVDYVTTCFYYVSWVYQALAGLATCSVLQPVLRCWSVTSRAVGSAE